MSHTRIAERKMRRKKDEKIMLIIQNWFHMSDTLLHFQRTCQPKAHKGCRRPKQATINEQFVHAAQHSRVGIHGAS